ncbi:MAG: glycosyltransferase family 39 protein [Acidobacteriota bacterium]
MPLVVFLVSSIILGWGLGDLRLGEGDLVANEGINAQDEAVYSFAAREMARSGDWVTPQFLGRYFLYKPPAVYWLSGVSAALLGDHAASYRIPAVLASAATCALLFAAVVRTSGWTAAYAAWFVLLSCPLWISLARRNVTDPIFCFAVTLAVVHARRAGWAFSVGTALAILTKGAAGAIPLAVAAVAWMTAGQDQRPALRQVLVAVGRVALLAAPWFAIQMWLHPRWFYEEFVRVELLAWGLQAPPQLSAEPFWWFYGKHLVEQHGLPVLLAAMGCLMAIRRGDRTILVPVLWALAMTVAIGGYSFRHATYLMPLIPAIAWLAASAPRWTHWIWLAAAPLLVVNAAFVAQGSRAVQPSIAALEQRVSAGVTSPLLVMGTGDHFHAALLPFPSVRYVMLDSSLPPKGFALDFRSMGIAVSVDEFLNLKDHRTRFEQVQREWGLSRHGATATVILFRDGAELQRLKDGAPAYDILETGPDAKVIMARQ